MEKNRKPLLKRIFNKKFFIKLGIFFIGVIFFIFLMDSVVMPWYTKHGDSFELPDVTDQPVEEAREILKAEGFHPLVKDSVYDEKFPPGTIVQQNPLPYTLVKEGRRVYLVVSQGDKPRYVPKLIGSTPQDARFRLKEEGLTLNRVIHEFSDFYPRGVVINQSILPGEPVDKNQKINITVSLGPAPTSLEVPNLIGKSLESARKELSAVGVKLGRVKYRYRANLVPGTVLNQSVSAGQNVVKVDSVSLLVSTDQPPQPEEQNADTTQ